MARRHGQSPGLWDALGTALLLLGAIFAIAMLSWEARMRRRNGSIDLNEASSLDPEAEAHQLMEDNSEG